MHEQAENVVLTEQGAAFVRNFGIDLESLQKTRAPQCRSCLGWSARQTHLSGNVGRALLGWMEEMGWCARVKGTRVVAFDDAGKRAFHTAFGA